MGIFAALDVSQEETAICVVDGSGVSLAEGKVATCPDEITAWLARWSGQLERLGMETGPLASGSGTPSRRGACRSSVSTRDMPTACSG